MTREEVQRLTQEERFVALGERYSRMQELLAEAQRKISDEEWVWGDKGLTPNRGGPGQRWAMPGSTARNSYLLTTSRNIRPAGATGERADAEQMREYFASQGWETSVEDGVAGDLTVRASTDDGYGLEYQVRRNGQYSLRVISRVFWGDPAELAEEVIGRIPEERLVVEASRPGDYIEFPRWDDPIVTVVD